MGESFRSITVRIGADTGSLQKALTVVTSAAKTAQNQLTRMNRALKLDPGSLDTAAEQAKALANRAEVAAQRVSKLRSALSYVAEENPMYEVAKQTENAGQKAAEALAQYNRIDAALEKVKTTLNGFAGKDIFEDGADTEAELSKLKSLGGEVSELAEKYERLHGEWQSAFDGNEDAKEISRIKDMEVELQSAEASLRNFNEQLSASKATVYANELEKGFDKAKSAIRALDEQAKSLDAELKEIKAALKLDPQSAELAAAKFKNLSAQAELSESRIKKLNELMAAMKSSGIDSVGKSMAQLTSEAKQSEAAFKQVTTELTEAKAELAEAVTELNRFKASGESSDDEFKKLESRVEACTAEVAELAAKERQLGQESAVASAATEFKEYSAQASVAAAKTASLRQQLSTLSSTARVSSEALLSIGMSAQTIITPVAQQIGQAIVESSNDIDSAYRSMRKTVQGTEEEFENMLSLAKEYSSTNYTSTDTMLSIEAMGGQLGIATENLNDFAVAISNIDIATDIDADTAAEDLGQMANIMSDLTEDKFGAFSDALVRLGNNNATLESNIMNVAQRIGSMGSILGMTTPQVLAWATAVASTGQNSEAAGTAISNTMSDIETAVTKGGSSLQGFADVAGMSAEQFAAKWESSPSEAMQSFVNGLARITSEGGSADGTLQDLGITGVRQKQALLGLAQTTDTLSNSLVMSEDAWNGVSDSWGQAGDASNEASQKSEGFSGQLQILQNNLQNAASAFGDGLIPIMQAGSSVLQAAADAFSGMSTEAKTATIVVGAGAAAFGPAATAISAVQKAVDDLKKRASAANETWDAMVKGASSAAETAENVTGTVENVTDAMGSVAKKSSAAAETATTLADVGGAVASSFKAEGIQAAAASIKTTLLSTASKAAAVAQLALNAAMKAAPFVGIAVAVGAVAAATVEVGTALAKAASGTEEYTGATKEAQQAVDAAQSSYDAAAAAHGEESDEALSAASALDEATAAYENNKETVGEFTERVKEACDSHDELMDSIKEGSGDADAEAGSILLLADKIAAIADGSDDAASKSAQLSGYIEQMNSSVGDLNLSFDEQTGKLSMTTDALKEYASTKADSIRSNQALENYNDLLEEQVTLSDTLTEAQNNLTAAQNDGSVTNSKAWKSLFGETEAYQDLKQAVQDAQDALDENAEEQEKQLKVIEDSTRKSAALSEAVSKCGTDTSKAAEAAEEASEKWGTYITEGEVSAKIAANQAAAQAELAEALEDSASELQEFADENPIFKKALESSGYSVGTLAQKLSDAGVDTSTFTSEVQSLSEKTSDAFNTITQASDASIDTLIENLRTNTETTNAWRDEITALYGAAGSDSEKAFVDYLKNLGPEYESIIKQMIGEDGNVTESFSQFASAWAEATEAGMDGSIQTTLAKSGDLKAAGETAAVSGAEGVESKSSEYEEAAKSNVEAANQVFEDNKSTMSELGKANGSNFAVGLWDKAGEASSAGSDVAQAAISSLSSYSDTAWQWGAHLGSNFAAGLRSKTGEAAEAGTAVTDAAGDSMHFSVPRKGIWSGAERGGWRSGTHLVQNFAKGIEDEAPELEKTVSKISSAAASALQTGKYSVNLSGNADKAQAMRMGVNVTMANPSQASLAGIKADIEEIKSSLPGYFQASSTTASDGASALLAALPAIIAENAPNLVIDNDAGRLIVDNRLYQLQRKAAMNRG